MILCKGISEKIEVATVAINEAIILKVKETIAIAIPIKSDNVNLTCQKVCFLRRCLHLGSMDSCQNKVSADQYHLTVSRAQVSTHQGRVLF